MSRPSAHLTWSELACKDGTAYPVEWRATRGKALAAVFETVRAVCGGKPMTVLSAYRTRAHNRRIKGADNSQHLHGRALDLLPPAGMTVDECYERIAALASVDARIGGLGRYKTFVHVDIRPRTAGRLVAWSGTGVKDATA